ncbi:UxaA family hydrolase [Alicyclobacillus dauci]|uniref:Altronate dehydratase family protein n=1 Tax=Alicyclobacillus dauci TaxID=1475485 RepID=A0ABY6Z6A4_9BACL|nr:altronate dehydratase family protein [Alicyclobacillus dauci]WAH38043.1 altronate dehydratase family protein [Alicyclobacillus dauci]
MLVSEFLLQIHPDDNVAVAVTNIQSGQRVTAGGQHITVREEIPRGHKVALRHISESDLIVKYGYPIGHATQPIERGAWVHTHNVKTNLSGKIDYEFRGPQRTILTGNSSEKIPREFHGYVRENGDVGIRNEIWIINTVGCINKTAERLAALAGSRYQALGVDGVYHFPHPYGCSQLGDDLLYTQRLLAALARHPNAAGVLVIGLGCENNQLSDFLPMIGPDNTKRVKYMAVQSVDDEFDEGLRLLDELAEYASTFKRTVVPVSKLKIGLKCGGSDAFSGITANPLVGQFSDLLVAAGGTSLLTEVPEMFGAETILMDRARDDETFDDIVHLINNFKDYYVRHGQVIYENPSPGNKDGGITTLEEKSLGCVQKGGNAPVSGVLQYGEPVQSPGLQLVQAPGNDMVSVTALIAAGAHMVLFTTGRGTPMGGAAPTLKISTNSDLCERKPHWIDFDAGRMMRGEDVNSLAVDLFAKVISVASGGKTKNEENGFREIAIFKDGVTL